ncbi:MAG: GNAT family N-acetyltransferase [Acidimicrobiia bacterium]|nr:GNAT family N-acetyltransferase [Acidimicrobiia bacterium]
MEEHGWPLWDLRIRTPRLVLRPPREADLSRLVQVIRGGIHEPGVTPFRFDFCCQPPEEIFLGTARFFWRSMAEWKPEKWSLILAVEEEGTIVGVQGVDAQDFSELRTVATGSWLGRSFQGRGIGKEMRHGVLHLAFAGLGAAVALSGARVGNAQSLGVSHALGYRENGLKPMMFGQQLGEEIGLRLDRADWERSERPPIVIDGLDGCRSMFGESLPSG